MQVRRRLRQRRKTRRSASRATGAKTPSSSYSISYQKRRGVAAPINKMSRSHLSWAQTGRLAQPPNRFARMLNEPPRPRLSSDAFGDICSLSLVAAPSLSKLSKGIWRDALATGLKKRVHPALTKAGNLAYFRNVLK